MDVIVRMYYDTKITKSAGVNFGWRTKCKYK
jgi:hypothetical protein